MGSTSLGMRPRSSSRLMLTDEFGPSVLGVEQLDYNGDGDGEEDT
jgi:hypothetical protein